MNASSLRLISCISRLKHLLGSKFKSHYVFLFFFILAVGYTHGYDEPRHNPNQGILKVGSVPPNSRRYDYEDDHMQVIWCWEKKSLVAQWELISTLGSCHWKKKSIWMQIKIGAYFMTSRKLLICPMAYCSCSCAWVSKGSVAERLN